MNRTALGLAIGAGYVLGRTKKMKLAIAVGTMVAGKRLNLSPRALGELVTTQLQNNPQFKEIGDQLREDLRGVGKAASGALVERQIEGLAGRLHSRTQGVRDQISGVAPDVDDVRDAGRDAGRKVTGVVPGSRGADDEAGRGRVVRRRVPGRGLVRRGQGPRRRLVRRDRGQERGRGRGRGREPERRR